MDCLKQLPLIKEKVEKRDKIENDLAEKQRYILFIWVLFSYFFEYVNKNCNNYYYSILIVVNVTYS